MYGDNVKRATKIATDHTLIGTAVVTLGSGADETMGCVRPSSNFA